MRSARGGAARRSVVGHIAMRPAGRCSSRVSVSVRVSPCLSVSVRARTGWYGVAVQVGTPHVASAERQPRHLDHHHRAPPQNNGRHMCRPYTDPFHPHPMGTPRAALRWPRRVSCPYAGMAFIRVHHVTRVVAHKTWTAGCIRRLHWLGIHTCHSRHHFGSPRDNGRHMCRPYTEPFHPHPMGTPRAALRWPRRVSCPYTCIRVVGCYT